MIRHSLLAILITLLPAAAGESVQAQPKKKFQIPPGNVFRLQFGLGSPVRPAQSPVYLLRNPKVQDELKLDGDQKVEIKEAFDGFYKARRDEIAKLRGLQLAERRKKLQEMQKAQQAKAKEMDKSLRAILKPEQLARLEQIAIQQHGLNALLLPEVVKKLKITDEQQTKIKEVQKAALAKQRKLTADVRNGAVDRTKRVEKLLEIRKERETKTLDVLTKEQRAEFEKMKGKKFDLGRRFGRPGLRAVPLPAGKVRLKRIRVNGKAIPVKPKVEKEKKDKDKAEE
jgi:hypothetical protein